MAPRVTGNSSSGRRVSPTIRALAMMVTATLAQSALTKDLAPIDRWADARPAARAHAPVIGAGLLSEFRGHVDDRLGVPTFLWAGPDASRSPMSPTVGTPEGIARVHLKRLADAYKVGADQIDALQVVNTSRLKNGSQIVQLQNAAGGIEVFRERISVLINPRGDLVSVGGYIASTDLIDASMQAPGARAAMFAMSGADAAALALADYGFDAAAAASASISQGEGGFQNIALPAAANGASLAEPARVKPVWFRSGAGLIPAHYVEVQVAETPESSADYYAYVISAKDGQVLFRHNQTAEHTYRVYAETTGALLPYPGPEGRANAPHPTAQPDGVQPPFVPSVSTTLTQGPISNPAHIWLAPGATETTGNNAEAYADFNNPDGFSAGDLRGATNGVDTFNYVYDTSLDVGVNATQRQAGIVNLFYMNNWLHDWYYDAGFDEASGNGQVVNYSGLGIGGDSIKAEAQDASGTNNANMSTPSDGGRPRMQMYTWSGQTPRRVDYLAGVVLPSVTSAVGVLVTPSVPGATADITNDVVVVNDGSVTGTNGTTTDACQTPFVNDAAVNGKIALVDRVAATRGCSIGTTLANAQANGAIAVLFINTSTVGVSVTGSLPAFTIPYFSVSLADGNAIKAAIASPTTVTLRLRREPPAVSREGGIDNAVIAHEWGHYISNRLVQNSAGLTNNTGRGMGEGWADFHSLLMQVKEDDDLAPSNPNYVGTYSVASHSQSGPSTSYFPNTGPYFGIRRYPYSTNFNKDPLTYGHTVTGAVIDPSVPRSANGAADNAAVHNIGEVWASMLWECYTGLLRDTGRLSFAESQDRMKRYIIAGYKLTPPAPTILEARDALLSAIQAEDEQDFQICASGFARRGAGSGAVAPDRFSLTNAGTVQSFAFDSAAEVVSATLDDSTAACDADGELDNEETGALNVVVRNSGFQSLLNTTVTVTSPTAGISFPNGNTFAVPASAAFSSVTVAIPVRAQGFAAIGGAVFDVEVNDPALDNAAINQFELRVNANVVPNSSLVDTFESDTAWTKQLASLYGPVPAGTMSDTFYWGQLAYSATDHTLYGPNLGGPFVTWLVSPPLAMSASDPFVMTYDSAHSFEAPNWDGGVIEYSTNDGATWADITTLTGATLTPAYSGALTATSFFPSRLAYRATNAAWPNFNTYRIDIPAASPVAGQTIRLRFGVAADSSAADYGWEIDNVNVSGVSNTPFTAVVAHVGGCNAGLFGDGFE